MRAVSSLLALALTTPMLAAGALTVAGPAGAAEADVWSVPPTARVTIRGHGYGHGHGMSQYGAEGAARQGLTYRQIAKFYYPGTAWGTSKGRVTVLLTADTTDDLIVAARPGLTVRDTAGKGRTVLPDNGARRWRVAVGKDGVNRIAYRDRRWHRWRALEGQGEFYAGGDPVTLVTPSGERSYRGRLRVGVSATGDRVTVNDVGLESYLKGVVPLEIPASWSAEAVRAQAVAARTYASYERRHPQSRAYQLCDTWSCQVYGGVDAEYPASNRAVDATAGAILTSDGAPAFTQFGSSSGGWTSAGSVPYLPAKRDPYDGWSGNPVHTWTTTVDDTRLEQAWPAIGNLRRIAVTARDGNGDWGGRVRTIALRGSRGRVVVSGDTFRAVLGLRSTWVTFRVAAV
ncbi:SpoIID/LytB domain-containing protein [Nocardioides sp.]|uniref:SpoIID/LytB domain-containing protein n=1 Tax=Nocardioides sp. TaxID=35761 RepID=UPI00263275C2|nr:SpoIID/LytB domain-containing protein [Nocardioides sp.]MDI6911730.1 SpoIID/LytB domain-containing protein [Nocardioides sp.]